MRKHKIGTTYSFNEDGTVTGTIKNGKTFLIDIEDYEKVKDNNWHMDSAGYIVSTHGRGRIFMHKFIIGCAIGMKADHINGVRIDNRRSNLREATVQQNNFNRSKRQNCTSKYKGVKRVSNSKTWEAYITKSGVAYRIGSYKTEEEGAMAYNEKAIELFGSYAKLNVI